MDKCDYSHQSFLPSQEVSGWMNTVFRQIKILGMEADNDFVNMSSFNEINMNLYAPTL